MLIAFQVLLLLAIIMGFFGTIGAEDKDDRQLMGMVTVISIIAMSVTFIVN